MISHAPSLARLLSDLGPMGLAPRTPTIISKPPSSSSWRRYVDFTQQKLIHLVFFSHQAIVPVIKNDAVFYYRHVVYRSRWQSHHKSFHRDPIKSHARLRTMVRWKEIRTLLMLVVPYGYFSGVHIILLVVDWGAKLLIKARYNRKEFEKKKSVSFL